MVKLSVPRVVYCGVEDTFFKRLSRHADGYVLEAQNTDFSGSPQKFARSKKAAVLVVKIKKEIDLRHQEWLARSDGTSPVIAVCQNSRIETAIHVLQYGAFDYFSAEQELGIIAQRVKDAIHARCVKPMKRAGEPSGEFLHGSHPEIQRINETVRSLARDNKPLLLYGEPGTGKEHLAFEMYRRAFGPRDSFARYDCRLLKQISRYDGMPVPALVNTASQEIRKRCNRGVLFLKHFEELNPDQRHEIVKAPSTSSSVKLVTSLQEPLKSPVGEPPAGHVPALRIPALRAHVEDVPSLTDYFIRKTARARKMRIKSVSPDVLMLMHDYPWPGNVQELDNLVERMMQIEPTGMLTAASWWVSQGHGIRFNLDRPNQLSRLVEEILKNSEGEWTGGRLHEEFMERIERILIGLVLSRVDYNQATAARFLGISRNTLREKIR
jgi:two-component system nitrogen regulation response regulator GlnG